MGFKGKEAAMWKEDYLKTFRSIRSGVSEIASDLSSLINQTVRSERD